MIQQTDIDSRIKALLDYELDKNIRLSKKHPLLNRNQIYDLVASQLGVHRVMVRRLAKKMVVGYVQKYNVLNNGNNENEISVSCIGFKQF